MRIIVRRERPHPGAQLSLFEERDGWRYQALATNTETGQLAFLEARHRAHARVEDRIRHAKDSGLGRFPSREFTINQAWTLITAIAADLVAWLRLLALRGDLAKAEPKALRYRLLHVPARLTHSGRRRRLRLPKPGPGQHKSSRPSPTSPLFLHPADRPPNRPPRPGTHGEPQPGSASRHPRLPSDRSISSAKHPAPPNLRTELLMNDRG